MESVIEHTRQVNIEALFTRAGFQIRGRRATCPNCEGRRGLTVSITDEGLWYCHRCHKGGSIRQLARAQGVALPPPRVRKANAPKAAFREWLGKKMREMANEEHRLTVAKRHAEAALQVFPEMDEAWQALADYYNKEQCFALFWKCATDNIGKYWMYRAWRKTNG